MELGVGSFVEANLFSPGGQRPPGKTKMTDRITR